MAKFEDLTGRQFGRLTVLKRCEDYISPSGYKTPQWLCQCNCENKTIIKVTSKRLKKGTTQSCGCLAKEKLVESNKIGHENKYDLSGDYGVGYTAKGEEFWFDKEDYDLIKNYCWGYDSNGYVRSTQTNKKVIRLHRLVMGVIDSNIKVDHKTHPPNNEHKKDNRKSNLRIVTSSKNIMNSSLRSDNSSGCTGVSFHKKDQKWYATITINQNTIWLGEFTDFEDAVKIRKAAEIKYFDEHRYNAHN